ncbi:MAG: hypothetical protein CFH33_01445 [Alphaproteobacteria bacterium MarineAlpha9_Bin3]|nr:MAG: hypothetical protein CFH33_01445 [Alphaproteobacteria bacterium MarineAlpha9_Bin3]|tara:strand:- start:2152 stop:2949 length:798 start_codon:yes stop_codon:yes gene_type:complete
MGLLKHIYIYKGFVSHYRFYPKIHKFKYRIFSLFINLEELDNISKKAKLFSINKFNLFSFCYKDHTEKPFGNPLFWARKIFSNLGLYSANDRIFILCYPRILGYVFNPLTTYFCIDTNNKIKAIIYEVHNTFGDRHNYVTKYNKLNEKVDKVFHVSPFFNIEGEYEFDTKLNNKSLKIEIKYYKKDRTNLLNAIFYGEQSEFNDKYLLLCFFLYPLMTLKVIYSIHFQALLLWIKGIQFFNRPIPSKDIISFSKTLIKDDKKNDK